MKINMKAVLEEKLSKNVVTLLPLEKAVEILDLDIRKVQAMIHFCRLRHYMLDADNEPNKTVYLSMPELIDAMCDICLTKTRKSKAKGA